MYIGIKETKKKYFWLRCTFWLSLKKNLKESWLLQMAACGRC